MASLPPPTILGGTPSVIGATGRAEISN